MDWSKYAISERHLWLNKVFHVTHVGSALSAFSDKKLRAGLVYDESKLNQHRILVVWVSPNQWTYGYRYGEVRLGYDWKRLLANRRAYWVEAITKYNPEACRILLTDVDRSDLLEPYDPESDNGPWQYDRSENQHYWNGDYTLEIMIESDLPLADATELTFVDHHRMWCAVDNRNCPDDFGQPMGSCGPRFLASLLGRFQTLPRELVWREGLADTRVVQATSFLRVRLAELYDRASECGLLTATSEVRSEVMRAVLAAYGAKRHESAEKLAGLFATRRDFLSAFEELLPDVGDPMSEHFELAW